ncbi:hypothetical protein ACFFJT_21105 [Dyella flava]|uniref:Hemagglutinin n=1 Tax=Dyella flava TaxID=1920170 RepID=A0ABS2K096_9GAMM|nr:hypothetical protein [Dyella flava]MBM7124561.1 hypothetical protein [Dyella flava]GLQ52725.1 hypothetical protein GCM10010872_41760 [Dyella flava]
MSKVVNFACGSGFGGVLNLGVPQKGSSNSDTNAWIAQGTIIVRGNPSQDLSGLDSNPTLDNQALAPIFDAQKVQEKLEMGQVAGQVGMTAAGDLATKMGWAEGSTERTILHGVVGAGIAALGGGDALQGALGASANQLVIQKMAEYLESLGYTPGTPEFATMLKLASTAVGAAVGGGTGAATALDGTTYNYLNHPQRDQKAQELAACKDQQCIDSTNAKWDKVSADQNLAMGKWAVATGSLPSSLVNQLHDTDPSSPTYVTLLNQAINLMGGPLNAPTIQLINETDGSGLPVMAAPQPYKYPENEIYNLPPPDYVSVGGNGLGAAGSFSMNLHDGQTYGSFGGSVPVTPGAGFMFGWIMNRGSNVLDPGRDTNNFLGGGSISGAGCYLLCVGLNHSFGGATAIEIGWGLGVRDKVSGSGGTGFTAPIPGTGPNLQQ